MGKPTLIWTKKYDTRRAWGRVGRGKNRWNDECLGRGQIVETLSAERGELRKHRMEVSGVRFKIFIGDNGHAKEETESGTNWKPEPRRV